MSNPTKYYSSKQEKNVASVLGWDVVSGSGARDFHPGDIIGPGWLGECKTHTGKGAKLRFDASVWLKICEEAHSKMRYPVLFVDDGSQRMEKTWCLYPRCNVAPSSWSAKELEHTIRTNLIIDEVDLRKQYDEFAKTVTDYPILSVHLAGQCLGIVPLSVFRLMFGG